MISPEEVRDMTNRIRPYQRLNSRFLLLLLIIGPILAANSARAEDGGTDIPLKVKDAWLAKLEKREPVWVQIENIDKWAQKPGQDISKYGY
jgi:hypothetical protein